MPAPSWPSITGKAPRGLFSREGVGVYFALGAIQVRRKMHTRRARPTRMACTSVKDLNPNLVGPGRRNLDVLDGEWLGRQPRQRQPIVD